METSVKTERDALRFGVALLVLIREMERVTRLRDASSGDMHHAARVYAVVTAARLAAEESARVQSERMERYERLRHSV